MVVDQVTPGSAAARARIQQGDILTTINGHTISSPTQLESVVGLFPVGKEVKISLIRGNLRHNLFTSIQPRVAQSLSGGKLNRNLQGTVLTPLSTKQKNLYRSEGVAVASVNPQQAGWTLGLRPGDVIFSLNRQPVRSLNEIEQAAALSDDMVILRIYRGEKIIEMIMR